MPEKDQKTYNIGEGGGIREHFYPMYECLEPEFLERIAKVMTSGAEKYGVDNFKKFDQQQVNDLARHVFKHIVDFMQGDISEDHLANASCNLMMMMYFESKGSKVTTKQADLSKFSSYSENSNGSQI